MKQISIAGNITRDAELRTTQSGDKVAGFAVAVNDRDKNATFFDCSLWGKRASGLAQYLTKGSKVAVCGELGMREYNGKTYLTVNVSEVTLMGGKPSQQGGYAEAGGSESYGQSMDTTPQQGAPAGGNELEDSIPFLMEWRG